MGTHESIASMLRESLPQFIQLADRGIDPQQPTLGYPTAATLLCVVDIVAGYLPKREMVQVRGAKARQQVGRDGWERFRVLNHRFFGFSFDDEEIKKVYDLSRNPLVHNGVVPFGVELTSTRSSKGGFEFRADGSILVSLPDLRDRCDSAVKQFLVDVDDLVSRSGPAKDMSERTNARPLKALQDAAASGSWITSESASAMASPPSKPTNKAQPSP